MREQRTTRTGPGTRLLAAAALPVGLVAAAALAAALGLRLRALLPLRPATASVDGVVEIGVVALGLALVGWLVWGLAVATTCTLARAVGLSWQAGERAVARHAPALVRRALVVALGAGLGVTGAVGAHATTPGDGLDVGWSTTTSTATRPGATTEGVSGDAPPTPEDAAVPTPGERLPAPPEAPGQPAPAPGVPGPAVSPEALAAENPSGAAGAAHPATTAAAAGTQPGAATTTTGTRPGVATPATGAHRGAVASPSDAAATSSDPARGTNPVAAHPPTGTPSAPATPAQLTDRAAAAPTGAGATPAPPTADAVGGPGTVVVAAGDTLWGIAQRALGPDATDQQVAAEWPRWYAANADVIGADPDRVLPGQVLRAPGAAPTPGSAR